VDGRIWRLVDHDPPTNADFRTHMELGKAPNADACLRCGLSVQPTEEDARHLLELQPRLGKFVAFADLDPQRGVIKQTLKAPHHTWWPDERAPRHDGFRVSR
jgi:hypothetical protein